MSREKNLDTESCNNLRNLTLFYKAAVNSAEELKENFFSFIESSDDGPIEIVLKRNVLRGNPLPEDLVRQVIFKADDPLFPVISYFNKIINADSTEITFDTIKEHQNNFGNLLEQALLKLQNTNGQIMLVGKEAVEHLIDSVYLIRQLTIYVHRSLDKLEKLEVDHKFQFKSTINTETIVLNFFAKIEKMLVSNRKKTDLKKLNGAISDNMLDAAGAIAYGYMKQKFFHQAKLYSDYAINLLKKITNSGSPHPLDFLIVLQSARINFEFGYVEAALELILNYQKMIENGHFFDNTYGLKKANKTGIRLLLGFLIEQFLPFFKDKNVLVVTLEGSQKALSLIGLIAQQNSDFFSCIAGEFRVIEAIYLDTQKKYLTKLEAIIHKFSLIVGDIKPDFDRHSLLITPKNQRCLQTLSHALKSLGIQIQILPNQNVQQIKVDLYRFSLTLLEKTFKKILEGAEDKAQLAKLRAEANLKLARTEPLRPEKPSTPTIITTTAPAAATTTTTTTTTSATTTTTAATATTTTTTTTAAQTIAASVELKQKPISPQASPRTPQESPRDQVSDVTYHWPKADLTYDSKEGNEGTVKKFKGDAEHHIPEGLYFGYIPDYVLENAGDYGLQFMQKLKTGKMDHDHIRWVRKEMQTLGKSECYLFKIVIGPKDPRLYAWVEDSYVEEEGKQHFLLCFGMLSNHKLKNLPNAPQKAKNKRIQHHQKAKPVMEALPQTASAQKFFKQFGEIIYCETLMLPEVVKTLLQESFLEFGRAVNLAKQDLNNKQLKELFSKLLKMNKTLLKFDNQALSATDQLKIVQDILRLLSKLEEEPIYSKVVSALVSTMKAVQACYVQPQQDLTSNSSNSSINGPVEQIPRDNQATNDDEAAEELINQITQASEEAENDLKNLEGITPEQASNQTEKKEDKTLTSYAEKRL